MIMNSWVPKTNILVIACSFLAVSLLVYTFSLSVINRKISSIELAYSNTANTLATEEESRLIKNIADQNFESIDFVNKYFVQKGDEVGFIEDVENLAKSLGIKFNIVSITPVRPLEGSESTEISIKMNVEGSWSGAVRFLDKLEKMPFGVMVQNFNLDKSGGSSWTGSIDFIVFN